MRYPIMICLVLLAGCSGSGAEKSNTGSFECVGYCSLDIHKSQKRVEVRPDGTVIETEENDGMESGED